MKIVWHELKAQVNLSKHGISFDEAATVFEDPLQVTIDDPDHSYDERRFLTKGETVSGTLLVVSHTQTAIEIRIISARRATLRERKDYEEGDEYA